MGIGNAMIKSEQVRGQALVLLALAPVADMLGELRLPLVDIERVRSLVFSCAEGCTRAAYHPGMDIWFVHTEALYQRFVQNSEAALFAPDVAALAKWFSQGQDLAQNDFPTAFWIKALIRKDGADWPKDGMEPAEVKAVHSLIADYWEAYRNPAYAEMCDAVRGATQSEPEIDLCDRFNINFYDDVMDPLVIFHDLRMGNILHQMLLARSDSLPLQHMHRVADAFLATPAGQSLATMISASDLDRVRSDIWTIRGL
jgi:hypothetical protein